MKARQFLVSSRVVCIIFRWNCFKRKETLFYQTQEVLSFNLASCSFPDLTWQKRIPACLSLFHLLNLAFCSLDKREFCTIDIGNSPNIGKTVSGRSCKMSQAPSPTINYRHQANVHLKLWTLQKNSEICHKHIHKQRKPILESPGNRK